MIYSVKILGLIVLSSLCLTAFAQEKETEEKYTWPLEIDSKEGFVVTLYQPQLESFAGNIIEGRMAVTIKPKEKDMIFGAVWFKATVSTDTEIELYYLRKCTSLKRIFRRW